MKEGFAASSKGNPTMMHPTLLCTIIHGGNQAATT